MNRFRLPRLLALTGLALVYAAAGRLSLNFAIPADGIPPLWLPAGIGLAVLTLGGTGYWPGVALGSLLIWVTTDHPPLVVAALVAADVLEPVLDARLLPRLGFRPTLERVRDVWTLAGSALLLSLLTASIGLVALIAGREVSGGFSTPFETWWTWFAARLLGIMVVAPLCLVWSRPAPSRPPLADRPLEVAALAATTTALAALAAWLLPGFPRLAMPAVLMVCVIWGASRGHQHGATLLTFCVAALCLLSVRFGPLLELGIGDLSLSPVIARFAVSLAVSAVTGLVLAASVIEREAAVSRQRLTGEVQRVLFELAPFGLIGLDAEQRVTAWNPAAERIFGWRADEVLGRATPVVQPEAATEAAALLRQISDGHSVQGVRVQRSRKDGSLVDLRVSLTPVRGDPGQLTRVISIVEDLSVRREDIESLREEEERYQLVFEGVSEAIFLHEAGSNRILDANLAAEQRYGYTHAELLGLTTLDLSAEPERTRGAIREGIDSGGLTVPLRWHRSKDGRIFPVTISIRRLSWRGRTAGVSVVRDISQELNQVEEARRREEYLEAMLAQASDFVTILDHTGTIRYQSPSVTRILGWKEEELVGRPVTEFLHEEDRPRLRDTLRRGLADPGAIVTAIVRIRRPDGSWRVLESVGRYLPDTPGIEGFLLNARDITERREAEAQSQRSRERYEIVANATSDVVWEWDREGPNSWWSEGLTRVFGWNPEELSPMLEAWSERIHPEDRPHTVASFHAVLDGDARHWRAEYRFRRKSGEYAMVVDQGWSIVRSADGRAIRMIGAITDVTEQREAERLLAESREQLRQATKMEAMGRLAGGIAHDFNNILTSLLGHAELALTQVNEGHPLEEDLKEIRASGRRAAGLTRQLLAFSRKQVLEPRVVDLNEIVTGIHKMLARVIGEDIELVIKLAPDLGRTVADPGQLEQVLVNLAVNARDAMPEGGRLTIETGNVPAGSLAGREGRAVRLSVSDTGSGMDPETQARIFEPFFTTKELGKGTGLGLAMAYGTVQQSGGQIQVESAPGHGTRFDVLLPEAIQHAKEVPDMTAGPPPGGGTETILLVEDEAPVREMVHRQLRQLGYRVLVAGNGPEALATSKQVPGTIDLVVTDVVMPGMSGTKFVSLLGQERPGIRVLYMSGYTGTASVQDEVRNLGRRFLAKPFTPEELAGRIRDALGD